MSDDIPTVLCLIRYPVPLNVGRKLWGTHANSTLRGSWMGIKRRFCSHYIVLLSESPATFTNDHHHPLGTMNVFTKTQSIH